MKVPTYIHLQVKEYTYIICSSILFFAKGSLCTLSDVCVFFSGANQPPPMGFPEKPTLKLLHDGSPFPTSSTCSLILRLPTLHSTYATFKEAMVLGIHGNDGFGGP